jgi:hypothetical protein
MVQAALIEGGIRVEIRSGTAHPVRTRILGCTSSGRRRELDAYGVRALRKNRPHFGNLVRVGRGLRKFGCSHDGRTRWQLYGNQGSERVKRKTAAAPRQVTMQRQ